ncbi:MAG: T9SS C-terminal target domain-containing protein [Saprospirales bacterium]|nr:MAG: T9SS C-terminal target domain-containing protein [Saprospirales bacterium]
MSPDINSELSNPSIATKVFPNPVIDNLSIESDSPIEKLLIFDVTGKLVADLDVGGAYQFDTLIFSQLPAGKYHLQLLSKEGIDIHNLIKH